jgi:deoxyribodipyrimidine photo-lyase
MSNLVWFRSDLRAKDNPALRSAMESGETHACVFLPTTQLRDYGHGERKIHFLQDSCRKLSDDLGKKGVNTSIDEVDYFENQEKAVIDLCLKQDIRQVFWNNEYPLDERSRDRRLQQKLEAIGIQVQRFDGSLILPPNQISTGKGEFYRVFTPFKRAWLSYFESNKSGLINNLEPKGDDTENLKRLREFTQNSINSYQSMRDFPAVHGTSHLSASLSAGTISPLRAIAEAIASNQGEVNGGSPEITTWISQLIWREFYYHLIARCDTVSKNQPFVAHTKKLMWNYPEPNLEYWKSGMTGIPIIDAGMRQLEETGWMHNRLRMITAMFLSKNLFIDWRHGEKYFLHHLEDGDFALNNGGWQWSASTGTDAAPYFRVFNPFTQAERFDPDAEFIKRYVPELESLPAKIIHSEVKLAAQRPGNYPRAIVNTSNSRKLAIANFKALRLQSNA